MTCSSPVPPSSSLSSVPTPTPDPSPSPPSSPLSPPPSSPLSPPPSSPLSPLSPMPPFSFSAHHSPLSLSASNPPALRSGTTDATTPESTGSPLTPVDSLPTAPPGFPERASEVPSSQLSDLLARLAPELITPPRLPPHLAPWLKSPTTPPPQPQTSPKTPNSYALPTVPDAPQDPVFSGRSPETPTRMSIPILALDPPPDWSGPWNAAKVAREIKWLLHEEVDDEEPAMGEAGGKGRMIRAAHRSLEINGARLNELESTLDVMMEHISTLEDKITSSWIQRNGIKRFLKELKGQGADQTNLDSERGESGDCQDASTGGEQMVAKRKAGEVLSSSDGEGHKAGRFKFCSSSSGELSEIPTKGKYYDEYILSDEDMKDRGLFDGISGSKAEPQIEGDNMTIVGAENKTEARRATEFVDGNVDGKGTPQPLPQEQKRPKPKYNLRSRGGESSKAGDAGAAQTREKTETGASMRDRWAYEAGVEHSTFSSMRRDGAAE